MAKLAIVFEENVAEAAVQWLEQKLISAHLKVDRDVLLMGAACLVTTAPTWLLSVEAEHCNLMKKCQETGHIMAFIIAEKDKFTGEDGLLFTAAEEFMLTDSILRRQQCDKVPEGLGAGTVLPEEGLIRYLLTNRIVRCVLPLNNKLECKNIWGSFWRNPLSFTLIDEICAYYGMKVTLYFAWMCYFTLMLVVPGIFGVICSLYDLLNGIPIHKSYVSPLYSAVLVVWGAVFVKIWDRSCSDYAMSWGTSDILRIQLVRKEFKGIVRKSPITGQRELYFSAEKRVGRYVLSVIVTLLAIMGTLVFMVISLSLRGYIHKKSKGMNYYLIENIYNISSLPLITFMKYWQTDNSRVLELAKSALPPLIHVSILKQMSLLYGKIAFWLTCNENHKFHDDHDNSLIIKRFVFESLNYYIGLFYFLLIEQDIEMLKKELILIYTVDSLRRIIVESLMPYISKKRDKKTLKKLQENMKNIMLRRMSLRKDFYKVDKELNLVDYDQFEDYLEMVIQYGYVTLFAGAFPLSAMLAVLCNIVELKSDLFKLTHVTQKPASTMTKDIGTWGLVVKVITWACILTNIHIFTISSSQCSVLLNIEPGPDSLWIASILEHGLVCVCLAITLLVPEAPEHVRVENARREFTRAKAAKKQRQENISEVFNANKKWKWIGLIRRSESESVSNVLNNKLMNYTNPDAEELKSEKENSLKNCYEASETGLEEEKHNNNIMNCDTQYLSPITSLGPDKSELFKFEDALSRSGLRDASKLSH